MAFFMGEVNQASTMRDGTASDTVFNEITGDASAAMAGLPWIF
jgi:hypothetical protein